MSITRNTISDIYGLANMTISYKLAEKLSERLDEMGKDLTSMIEEVNGASSTLTKTNKADEPVSHKLSIDTFCGESFAYASI